MFFRCSPREICFSYRNCFFKIKAFQNTSGTDEMTSVHLGLSMESFLFFFLIPEMMLIHYFGMIHGEMIISHFLFSPRFNRQFFHVRCVDASISSQLNKYWLLTLLLHSVTKGKDARNGHIHYALAKLCIKFPRSKKNQQQQKKKHTHTQTQQRITIPFKKSYLSTYLSK